MRLNIEKAAQALAEADVFGDERASRRTKVSLRTIGNYRKRVQTLKSEDDRALAERYAEKRKLLGNEWREDVVRAIRRGVARIEELIEHADVEQLRDVVGAVKVLGDLDITKGVLSDEDRGAEDEGNNHQGEGNGQQPATDPPGTSAAATAGGAPGSAASTSAAVH